MHRVTIHNFQSHKDTVLELSPTVNSFEGVSDSGKSAILRAMLWCLTNKPDGIGFVSAWAKTGPEDKKRLTGEASVSIDNITRVRNSSMNGYVRYAPGQEPQTYEAVKATVPPDIEKAINIDAVNIQRQLDPSFLVTMTPGNAARYVNSLVGLEDIDAYQKALKGKAHDNATSIKDETKRLESAKASLEEYAWVPDVRKKVDELAGVESQCNTLAEDLRHLQALDSIAAISAGIAEKQALEAKATRLIESIPDTAKLESDVDALAKATEVASITSALIVLRSKVSPAAEMIDILSLIDTASISDDIAFLDSNLAAFKKVDASLASLGGLLPRLERLITEGTALNSGILVLESNIADIDAALALNDNLSKAHAELQDIESSLMGKVCPVCGKPL